MNKRSRPVTQPLAADDEATSEDEGEFEHVEPEEGDESDMEVDENSAQPPKDPNGV